VRAGIRALEVARARLLLARPAIEFICPGAPPSMGTHACLHAMRCGSQPLGSKTDFNTKRVMANLKV
jgi:hypothetical protein